MSHLKSHAFTKTLTAAFAFFMLLPSGNAAEANLGLANQLFIVDHSGSMQGQYEWIGEAALALQAEPGVSTKFGLAEFSKDTRAMKLGGSLLGNAEQFNRAVKQLRRSGGTEDGYFAIDKTISQYSVARLFAPHIILVTDEHRTSVNHNVNVNSISARLAEAKIPVTAIVNVRFLCEDKRRALGMNSRGLGILLNTDGKIEECRIGELIEPHKKAHSVTDYIDLALSTGGSVWDVLVPRKGKTESALFASAFSQVHAAAISQELEQHDAIPKVTFSPEHPKTGDVITFNASESRATQEGDYMSSWQWDFESDRQVDSGGATVAHSFTKPGTYKITLSIGTAYSERATNHSFHITVK
ncbi:MAG: PKD domain-containing protein [Gammaproteobacteria bacterium]